MAYNFTVWMVSTQFQSRCAGLYHFVRKLSSQIESQKFLKVIKSLKDVQEFCSRDLWAKRAHL